MFNNEANCCKGKNMNTNNTTTQIKKKLYTKYLYSLRKSLYIFYYIWNKKLALDIFISVII